MKLRHVHHSTFDNLICVISIICLAVVLVLVLVLKDIFQVLVLVLVLGGQVQEVLVLGVRSLSWSLGVRSLLTSLMKRPTCFNGCLSARSALTPWPSGGRLNSALQTRTFNSITVMHIQMAARSVNI